MAHLVTGIFSDSQRTKEVVEEMRNKGYTDAVSVIAKDTRTGDIRSHIAKEAPDSAATGAVAGGTIGALIGILAGAATVVAPGIGPILIYGPLTLAWGITGGALGALAGGLIGALTNLGIPVETARAYEERIKQGDALVVVSADHEKEEDIKVIMEKHGGAQINVKHD